MPLLTDEEKRDLQKKEQDRIFAILSMQPNPTRRVIAGLLNISIPVYFLFKLNILSQNGNVTFGLADILLGCFLVFSPTFLGVSIGKLLMNIRHINIKTGNKLTLSEYWSFNLESIVAGFKYNNTWEFFYQLNNPNFNSKVQEKLGIYPIAYELYLNQKKDAN